MTRTLVTGATGFTGRYLVPLLAERGDEVHGLGHSCEGDYVRGLAKMHLADLADASAVRAVVEEVKPDHVVHLAAVAFVGDSDIEEMYRSNIVGTRQLLQGLAECFHQPISVLVASSANIYGNAREGVLSEDIEPAPANDYGVTKVATEALCSIYASRLPLIVARPFNYTGRGQSEKFLIPKIIRHAIDRAPVLELGNIDVSRDFSDVRTVVDAYRRLLEMPEAIGKTFNVASGSAVSLREVIRLVEQISGHKFDIRVNPNFVRPDEVKSLHGSAERLVTAIGPLRSITLEDTLRWMLEG